MSSPEQSESPTRRVFISYSQHDPVVHSKRVLAFAQALAADGLDVELDQYHQNESVDWPRWCEERLRKENSDFVLMICSAEYKNRIEKRVPADKGRGVFWEGSIIDDYLYEAKANERFIPILLDDESEESLPRIVRGWTWFKVSGFGIASGEVGYTNLYRLLTAQPGVIKPKLGERKVLSPEQPSTRPLSHSPIKPTNLPYPSLGPLFKGREDFINTIRAGFAGNPERAQAISARQAVHGLGGIGKTRAAVEYAWRFATDYTALLFVSAETPLDFRANVAALCPVLKIAEGLTDDTLRFEAAIDWLRDPRHRGWLLIADNLDTPEAADEATKSLATLNEGHVLIAGRLSEWPAFVHCHSLDILDRDAATEFLLARTADKRDPHESDADEARMLADELDGLALVLEQAAAFIRRHGLSFSEYLQRWRAADARVRQWHDARTMQYERPFAVTWQATIDMLQPASWVLLQMLAWLAPDPIPRFLFNHDAAPEGLEHLFENRKSPREILRILSLGVQADPESAFAELREFSLLQPARKEGFADEGQLHRIVSLITREQQSAEVRSIMLRGALGVVMAANIGDPTDVRSWPVLDALRPHGQAVVNFADRYGIAQPTAALMIDLGLLLATKAQYVESEPLYRRALEILETKYGKDHPEVASALHCLGLLLQTTNRIAEAEPLFRRALAINEKGLGPEHPSVATSLNNLGVLLQATNRLAEVEPLFRRALAIDERSYGPEDPKVATTLNNLAELLHDTNRDAEAEPLMSRVVVIREKAFGTEHPEVAEALNNLAALLQRTGRPAEAEPLYRRILAIHEKSFGPEHPNVARTLNNLAVLLGATDRLAEAEPLHRQALAIEEKSFGPEHPRVATSLNNLALLLQETNRLAEAESLMRRNLVILLKFTRDSGHLHPHLRGACDNYYGLLARMKLSEDQVVESFTQVRKEAQFDRDDLRELWGRIFSN